MKYRWSKEEEETRQMYDMVVKIIGKFQLNLAVAGLKHNTKLWVWVCE